MSIFSQLLKGNITFHEAAQQTEAWAAKIVVNSAPAQAVVSDVKQAASDAIGFADTAIDTGLAAAVTELEASIDALLVKYTGGVGGVLTPFVNQGFDRFAGILKGVVDAQTLKAKAALAPQPSAVTAP